MVSHSSIAWRTPWTEEPGVPQSMGSQRVGYNLVNEQQQKGTKEHLNFPRTKAMAPHSSTLAWKIPWMEEPGRLQPMGLLRVGHD